MNSDLSLKDKISLFNHTERSILLLVKKDSNIFNIEMLTEYVSNPPTKDSNELKAITLFLYLQSNGFIKQVGSEFKLTIKGKWALIYSHPAKSLWGIIIGSAIGIFAIVISTLVEQNKQPKQAKPPTKQQTPPPIRPFDSSHPKKNPLQK